MVVGPWSSSSHSLWSLRTAKLDSLIPKSNDYKSTPIVAAVSYLNTVPLVWGALHGGQRSEMRVEFHLPSICADLVREKKADIGILPVIEIARQDLEVFPGACIASDGPVRSILLISKVSFGQIKTLACDHGSRTSVMLARVILREMYGAKPKLLPPCAPELATMLQSADAALIIGDPALAIEPGSLPYSWIDLGEEWRTLTGLPMVFAAWAGAGRWITPRLEKAFAASLECGLANLDTIVAEQSKERGFAEDLIREYLTRNIAFNLGPREYEGMRTFLNYAGELESNLSPLAERTSI